MAKFDNKVCRWIFSDGLGSRCTASTWVLPNGLRVDTPYCESHARQWSDSRATDLEASMGN